MKKLVIVGIGLLALIVVSCNPPGVSTYFPLALNNTWSYKVTTVTTMKGTIDTTITSYDSTKTTVVADTTINTKKAWKLESKWGGTTSHSYVVEQSDAILSYSTPSDSSPATMLKALSDNATWVMDSAPSSGKLTATVKVKESVTVPAATFSNAWKVEEKYDSVPQYPMYLWYAPDVGQVKMQMSMTTIIPEETTSVDMKSELTGYTVK